MIGMLLCGGMSTRMGTDKGLLPSISDAEKLWADTSADLLQQVVPRIVYSINSHQEALYSTAFKNPALIVDDEKLSIKGPLLGIISTHLRYPKEDILLLACDMQKMSQALLKNLFEIFSNETIPADAYVYTVEKKIEPLCALISTNGLKKIISQYIYDNCNGVNKTNADSHAKNSNNFEQKTFSMQYALSQLQTTYITLDVSNKRFFQNFNSKQDLLLESGMA